MNTGTTSTTNPLTKVLSDISSMKESTAVFLLTVVTLVIILIAFIYYFYFNRLKGKECSKMDTIYGTLNGKLKSIDPNLDMFQHSLRDYYIKTAYNCCSGGNYKNDYVDTCSLKALLKQGVRGLDFEIFSIDDQPVIATSTSDSYYVKETFNYVPFSAAMDIIRDYAFVGSAAPNPLDPIFIHLRIKSTNQAMYKNFAKIFENYGSILLGKDYSFENNGSNLGATPIKELMGKAVIIVDRTNNSFLESQEFYEYVNMTSNSVFMRAQHYYDIKYAPDINELIEFNKLGMTLAMPDKGSNPENPSGIVLRETGCQLLGMRYQKVDTNVQENDVFFDESGYAIVLKPEKLRYIPVTVPAPPPQNPDVSYATRTVKSDFYKFEI